MKKISKKKLNEILVNHKHWLDTDVEGWENMRADLSGIDLSHADLSYADLSYAVLQNANLNGAILANVNLSDAKLDFASLSYANLYGAKLKGSDLQYANLENANLAEANLNYANLHNANLSRASLFCASLCFANLREANLQDADLANANLSYTDLHNAVGNLIEYRRGKVLETPLIGYKKCENNVIITLEIPEGAIVFSVNGNRCRTNRAKIVAIDGADEVTPYFENTTYHVNDEITIDDFNCEYNMECSGISFFTNREDAEKSF